MNNIPVEEGSAEGPEDATQDDDVGGMAIDDIDDIDDSNVAQGLADDEQEWDGIMEVDDGDDDTPEFFKELNDAVTRNQTSKTPSRRKKTKLGEIIREKIRKVLEDDTELADKRASKCDENDFLRLLFAFNSEGIHFA